MPRSVYKLLIPLLFLIFILVAVFKNDPQSDAPKTQRERSKTTEFDPSQFLVRPFFVKENQVALALDGGAFPVAKGEVPSIAIGKNILRTVHLAWVHDWSEADCRNTFKNLHALYNSEQGAALPAVKIYLNPIFSDPAGEELHRAMLQVLSRSQVRENYLILANEISTGKLLPDPEAIRKRMEELDPMMIDDWTTRLDWFENDIEKTFATAKIQQARNTAILGQQSPTQLISMLAILPSQATTQEISDFIQDANTKQRTWLQKAPPTEP
jgi:hypothetical protein